MSADPWGIAFPFRIDPATGGVAGAGGAEKIRQNLKHLLLTGIGERVMRRGYGGGIRQLLHDPNNDALRAVVRHRIGEAITKHEPRVELRQVAVTQLDGNRVIGRAGAAPPARSTPGEGSQLVAELRYTVRRTGQPGRVAVPLGGNE